MEEKIKKLEEAITILAKAQQQTTEVLNSIVEALSKFVEATKKAGIK